MCALRPVVARAHCPPMIRAAVTIALCALLAGCGGSEPAGEQAGTVPTAGTVSISGTWAVGATLTASPSGFDLGAPAGSYHYAWERCPDPGCATSTAVGTDSATYALAAADVDAYVRVGVHASNACAAGCGSSATAYAAAALVAGAAPIAGTVSNLRNVDPGLDAHGDAGRVRARHARRQLPLRLGALRGAGLRERIAVGTDAATYVLAAADAGSFRAGITASNACA